jgi:hypothetical protein
MLKEMLEKREELLDAVDHACWQIRHMAKKYKRDKNLARMPQMFAFALKAQTPPVKISEG